jgi:predicted RNase H-like nuclease
MTSILAIDPAWTATEPSGIALLTQVKDRWRCVAVSPSYRQFVELADGSPVDWSKTPSAGRPDADALLGAASTLLGGGSVDLVTVDMPIALTTIRKRREADTAVSQKFGSKGCSTLSPSETRPGEIGSSFTQRLNELGYKVATIETPVASTYVVAEVYPHPALLHLLDKDFRFKYKIGRASEYWPEKSPADRRRRIVKNWHKILDQLSLTINKIDLPLPSKTELENFPSTSLKRFEDAIDALVCGWVGVKYLEGDCAAYGDESAAIWIPPLSS